MEKEKIEAKIGELSVPIDILQSTTAFYEEMESADAKDLITLNKIVLNSLRDIVNDIIGILVK